MRKDTINKYHMLYLQMLRCCEVQNEYFGFQAVLITYTLRPFVHGLMQ